MRLSIALPGLIWPDSGDSSIYNQITTPGFNNLIKRASLRKLEYSFSDLIYATYRDSAYQDKNYRYTNHQNDTHNAPLVNTSSLANKFAKQLGVDADYPYFLIAEPTHLRVDCDRALICETELLKLSFKESQIIIDSINSHFRHEIKLYAISTELWLIGLSLDISGNQFYPILDIIGENIDNYLPKAKNGIELNKILNEIQMLLFNLPENQTRKEDGLLTINSLWLWDKTPKPNLLNNYSEIHTNISLVNFNNAKIKPLSPPYFKKTYLNNSLLIFDDLHYPCSYRDFESWIEELNAVSDYLAKELDVRQFSQIDILVPSTSSTLGLSIRPHNKYKIWKKNLKLIDLFRIHHAL
jgi:hypothetical protein